jgi:hypothetical protein
MSTVNDFDFLFGRWSVHNRRLATRLRDADDWYQFDASAWCEPRLDGVANVDQIDCASEGFSGLTLRLFDTAQKRWSIYWINSRSGVLFPPVHGGFEGTRGLFFGEDSDDGRAVQVRFEWNVLGTDAARWEQAFSLDGQAWETNWVMEFERESAR